MARKSDIQYVQFYTDGSAARQFDFDTWQPKKKKPKARPRRQKKIVLHVDFVAVAGMLVAGIMLLLMLTGMSTLAKANEEVARLENMVAELESENLQLHQTYREGYDLDQIREEALEMGMIPAARATTVSLQVEETAGEIESASSFWSFLAGLFA